MSKCRLIDMEAYSRGEIRFIDGSKPPEKTHTQEHRGDICPNCGQHTLIHQARCAYCPACGYDKCNLNG